MRLFLILHRLKNYVQYQIILMINFITVRCKKKSFVLHPNSSEQLRFPKSVFYSDIEEYM
jgi:hypothetical protein